MELGTYRPDALVFFPEDGSLDSESKVDLDSSIGLDSETFSEIRQGTSEKGRYGKTESNGHQYVLNNKDGMKVGFMFSLHGSFVSGQERVLKIRIPQDKDSNSLTFTMSCQMMNDNLVGSLEGQVYVNGQLEFDSSDQGTWKNPKRIQLLDSSLHDNEVVVSVVIRHDLDYNRRDTDNGYAQQLRGSGIVLKDIWIDNGSPQMENLTFGSYVNEDGISSEERDLRLLEFWDVSRFQRNFPHQTVLGQSLSNSISNGLEYPNNYSTGDIYGDVFATKSFLDNKYDMSPTPVVFMQNTETGELERYCSWKEYGPEWKHLEFLRMDSREYIGLGQCSNQLYLTFNPSSTYFQYGGFQDKTYRANEVPSSDDINYQMVEVVKSINRFESSIKHKSNLFSVVVENTNLSEDKSSNRDDEIEKLKERMRNSITQFVRDTCRGITPAHTQLFDVQFK